MRSKIHALTAILAMASLISPSPVQADSLRLHAIFSSDMVLQREKPITIWGWAAPEGSVSVQLGADQADATAAADDGRWQVTLPARVASAGPQTALMKLPRRLGSRRNQVARLGGANSALSGRGLVRGCPVAEGRKGDGV
jgi:hypothetical protein